MADGLAIQSELGLVSRVSRERAIHTVNRSVRRTNFWTVQRRLNQQAYWIPVYYQPDISTADRRVTGFQPNSALGLSTGNVYAWKVRAR